MPNHGSQLLTKSSMHYGKYPFVNINSSFSFKKKKKKDNLGRLVQQPFALNFNFSFSPSVSHFLTPMPVFCISSRTSEK